MNLGIFCARLDVFRFGSLADDFDAMAAQHSGEVRNYMERRGELIGAMDMLIVAHACSLSSVLVTNNERGFSRVPGLQIENWIS